MRQACSDLFSSSLNGLLTRVLRSATDKPLYVGHAPQKAVSPAEAEPRQKLLDYASVCQLLAAAAGQQGAQVVPQPEATFVDGWFTDMKYSVGSTRLDVGDRLSGRPHPPTDRDHMNKAFGKLWLAQLFQRAPAS